MHAIPGTLTAPASRLRRAKASSPWKATECRLSPPRVPNPEGNRGFVGCCPETVPIPAQGLHGHLARLSPWIEGLGAMPVAVGSNRFSARVDHCHPTQEWDRLGTAPRRNRDPGIAALATG